MANEKIKESTVKLVKALSEKYNFTIQNYDIDSHSGVYSHGQAKKRWGRSVWLYGDDFDPGENFMKYVIETAGGTYYRDQALLEYANYHQPYLSVFLQNESLVKTIVDEFNNPIQSTNSYELWKDRYDEKWAFVPYNWMP
jgi:hypothetical protein